MVLVLGPCRRSRCCRRSKKAKRSLWQKRQRWRDTQKTCCQIVSLSHCFVLGVVVCLFVCLCCCCSCCSQDAAGWQFLVGAAVSQRSVRLWVGVVLFGIYLSKGSERCFVVAGGHLYVARASPPKEEVPILNFKSENWVFRSRFSVSFFCRAPPMIVDGVSTK